MCMQANNDSRSNIHARKMRAVRSLKEGTSADGRAGVVRMYSKFTGEPPRTLTSVELLFRGAEALPHYHTLQAPHWKINFRC